MPLTSTRQYRSKSNCSGGRHAQRSARSSPNGSADTADTRPACVCGAAEAVSADDDAAGFGAGDDAVTAVEVMGDAVVGDVAAAAVATVGIASARRSSSASGAL